MPMPWPQPAPRSDQRSAAPGPAAAVSTSRTASMTAGMNILFEACNRRGAGSRAGARMAAQYRCPSGTLRRPLIDFRHGADHLSPAPGKVRMAVVADPRERRSSRRPKAALHRRKMGQRARGGTLVVEDPSTGRRSPRSPTPARGRARGTDRRPRSQAEWREHPPRERGEILRRAYELMIERADDLALLMTLEMGKPVAESKAEIATRPSSSAGSPRRRCASTAAIRSARTGRAACS